MSSARERAAEWLGQIIEDGADDWTQDQAIALGHAWATIAVADEIRALRETLEPLTKPVLLDAALSGGESDAA